MSRAERPAPRRGSPRCPDVQRDGGGSPLSPLYRSSFEDECCTIAARLLASSALITSTPLKSSPPLAAGSPPGSAFLGAPRRLVLPRASGCSRPPPRRVGRFPPARSPGRAAGRPSVARRASVEPKPRGAGRGAGKGSGTPAAKPPVPPGAKLKAMPAAKSRLQHPTARVSQLALPSAGPEAPPQRDKAMETAGKAGGRRQPPQRLPTAIPTVASRSRLQPVGKVSSSKHTYLGRTSESTPEEPVCNRTRELMENDKADQMWVCVGSPYLSVLHPGPAPGCGDAACAAQYAVRRTCAGAGPLHGSLHPLTPCPCQLSQELEHVKKELQRVKGQLADKTAECEAYCQTISSLQAQLRAAGICPEDAAEDKNSVWERN